MFFLSDKLGAVELDTVEIDGAKSVAATIEAVEVVEVEEVTLDFPKFGAGVLSDDLKNRPMFSCLRRDVFPYLMKEKHIETNIRMNPIQKVKILCMRIKQWKVFQLYC